jgi:hypothetical protein
LLIQKFEENFLSPVPTSCRVGKKFCPQCAQSYYLYIIMLLRKEIYFISINQSSTKLGKKSGSFRQFLGAIFRLLIRVAELVQELIVGPPELQAVQSIPSFRRNLNTRPWFGSLRLFHLNTTTNRGSKPVRLWMLCILYI